MKKLNIGCGEFKKDGFVNLDVSGSVNPDMVHDLNQFPYPFKDQYFDLIEANHVLEHLNNPFEVMREANRILKQKGTLIIRVPHFSRAMTHPEHKRGFDVTFLHYFDKNFMGGYTGTHLICEKMRLHWFAQHYLMKRILPSMLYYVLSGIGKLIDIFANLSPSFCSRVWCFWVGGFYELEFVFRKP